MASTSGGGVGANPMSFAENQHGSVVLERLRAQREHARFCDVVLVVSFYFLTIFDET